MESYLEIRNLRDEKIKDVSHDHFLLNHLHDKVVQEVVHLSISRIINIHGPLPCPFSFFVMGSAGRMEQSFWSDQDHGIIYHDTNEEAKTYFLALGNEISLGLNVAGYDYCDGGVMANNPLWCKSSAEWKLQLTHWMLTSSWESIRHLLIFIDGRPIYGESEYLKQLKTFVFQSVKKENLLKNILNNTMYLKKSIGVLGQFLVETHGKHTGSINLKETAFLPYVNAVRILAIKGNIYETSTLARLEQIKDTWICSQIKDRYQHQYLKLLHLRLSLGDHTTYETGHYLKIDRLSKVQKKEVKDILKSGASLFGLVRNLVEKENEGWE
nr:DUF294 nucleotidyltransferase-like domain-containing protein [Neobacillus sp. Marseille-Q6967]